MAFTLASCAGYHFNTNNNPLIGYDIHSVAVPMFINRSVLPDLAAPMTREITLTLSDYSGLKVLSGNKENTDAVLIGVIESKDYYNEVVTTTQTLFTGTEKIIKPSIGARTDFYYPVQTTYALSLKVILIKNPSPEEIALASSNLGELLKANPKVVLVDTINLSGTFSRVVGETSGAGSIGKTNFVKNKGIFEKSLQETALNAADLFKQVVLNAF